MLYDLYDASRQGWGPWSAVLDAWLGSLPAPAHPWRAGPEMWWRAIKDYPKPEFGIDQVAGPRGAWKVKQRVRDVTPFCRLLEFERESVQQVGRKHPEADPLVLVVAPLSGHHATLLRETVRSLLPNHRVCITDWSNARDIPIEEGPFGLDDYVTTLERFAEVLGMEQLHILAVCQPVVPVLGMVALRYSRGQSVPRTMVLMGGPIDSRESPTQVNGLATRHSKAWFENHLIHAVPGRFAGKGRQVYPGFLQHLGFVSMNPQRHAQAHWDFFEGLLKGDEESAQTHRAFYDEYNAVMDMPAEYYLDTIGTVFQQHLLPRGRWQVNGSLVRPQDIKQTALLTIEGQRDDIAGTGQTFAAHRLCSGLEVSMKEHFLADTGHYGLFSGKRWHTEICPRVAAFIEKHRA